MSGHEAVAVRRPDGWSRWFASCPCGYTENGSSKQEAEALAARHQRDNATVGEVLAQVRSVAERLRCTCYDVDEMEYDPDGPCPKCALLELVGA